MSHDDIWEYIKGFVFISDYYKMSRVSKQFSRDYNVKRMITDDDMKAVYKIQGATPRTILDIINFKVLQRYSYRYNKYIHANITAAIYNDNIFNAILYNGKLETIKVIYALLYSAISQKYKNIIDIINEFNHNSNIQCNTIDIEVFTAIMHFMLNYLKDYYHFKRYSQKIEVLCKITLSLIIIITVKTQKIKGVDDVGVSGTATLKNKIRKAHYNEVINEKIVDITGSVLEYQSYFPKFFSTFLFKGLDTFYTQ
jgi:hypothetical protein